jgi:hypothetical protein
MLVFGVILLVVGVACFYFATQTQKEVHAMMAAETLSGPELEELRSISDDLGARGSFRKICEVVGAAHPGPQGMLRAELTGTECVWYGNRVQRRYTEYSRDSEGRQTSSTQTETVAEHSSPEPFALLRDGHVIVVDHGGQKPDGAQQVTDRFVPGERRTESGFLGALSALAGKQGDETLGYQYTEWVLRPGTAMYVLGEVHDMRGALTIGRPADRKHPFLISTKSEEELTADARGEQKLWAWGGAGIGLVGVALIAFGLI